MLELSLLVNLSCSCSRLHHSQTVSRGLPLHTASIDRPRILPQQVSGGDSEKQLSHTAMTFS